MSALPQLHVIFFVAPSFALMALSFYYVVHTLLLTFVARLFAGPFSKDFIVSLYDLTMKHCSDLFKR